jgi:hypothetical protein
MCDPNFIKMLSRFGDKFESFSVAFDVKRRIPFSRKLSLQQPTATHLVTGRNGSRKLNFELEGLENRGIIVFFRELTRLECKAEALSLAVAPGQK